MPLIIRPQQHLFIILAQVPLYDKEMMSKIEMSGALQNPKVEAWLGRLGPSTARVYETIFSSFMKWVRVNGGQFAESSPEDLVEYQMEATNSHRFEIVDLIQGYVNSIEGRAGYKRKVRSTLRSFFVHNRCELPKDPSYIIRGDEQRVIGTLTIEEVKTLILRSNPTYQAIFLSMLQGGLGLAEVEHWNLNGYKELEQQLSDKRVEVIKVSLPGRKKARFEKPYYTLLGPDSINAIRNWLETRPENAEAIFTNKYGDPVTKNAISLYWRRHLRDLGIITKKYNDKKSNRYGKNPHELRTIFRSQWEKTPAKMSVAEYLMGHQVDPLDYNQAFKDEAWTRKQYKLALPMLQIISSGRPFGQVDEDEIEVLKRQLAEAKAGQNGEVQALRVELEEMKKRWNTIEEFIEISKAKEVQILADAKREFGDRYPGKGSVELHYPIRSIMQMVEIAKKPDQWMTDEELKELFERIKRAEIHDPKYESKEEEE